MLSSAANTWVQKLFRFRGKSNTYIAKFRKFVTLPATFNGQHVQPQKIFGIPYNVIPLRWQSLALTGFTILNLIFMFADYDVFDTDSQSKTAMYRRYIADRTGIIATALCVPLFLFAGRNNILMYLSGWSFETFNVFHRWVGRWMMLQSAVHGIAYSFQYALAQGHAFYVQRIWHLHSIFAGTLATLIAGIMCILAFYPLRHHFYETFLILHIGLSIVFVYYVYIHCVAFGYAQYMYCMVAIWGFDRFVRILRILYAGLKINAKVTVYGDAVYLTVKPMLHMKPKPGQYAYIYLMKYKFWESHPFSVMQDKDGSYVFVTRAEKGMTKYLRDRVSKMENQEGTVSVWIEGWYGEEYPIKLYDTILLVGGGIGVTAVMHYALHLNKHLREGQHVIFLWVVRGQDNLKWAKDQVEELSRDGRIDIRIYARGCEKSNTEKVHQLSDSDSAELSSSDKEADHSSLSSGGSWSGVTMNYEDRPDLEEIIHTTIVEAPSSVAVVTCGPGSLADTCRHAVAANVEKGNGHVDYFEDAFSWA
ncbi:ferric reductase NAD binding domain-containing protein [Lipomyces oligophaga]|uniref:ferric reductase NAD binding domain-containing protein n=1 Tax=Lipomyces oligophaga TaxID=45792 RepID=UPI0034CDE9F0